MMTRSKKTLRRIYAEIIFGSLTSFLMLAIPTVLYFHERARTLELKAHVLSTLESIQPLQAQLRYAAIENNSYLITKIVREIEQRPAVRESKYISNQDLMNGTLCKQGKLFAEQDYSVCLGKNEVATVVAPLSFANRSYGAITLTIPSPPHTSELWYMALISIVILAILGTAFSYLLGISIFRRHIAGPINDMLEQLRMYQTHNSVKPEAVELVKLSSKIEELIRSHTQSAGLAASGQIAAEVAHDLRQPLTTLGTFTRNLKSRIHEQEFLNDFFEHVPVAIEQLTELSNDMLELSKEVHIKPKEINLTALVTATVSEYQTSHPDIAERIQVEGQEQPINWSVDEHGMKRVVTNLLENAQGAMNGIGKIRVRFATSDSPADRVEIQIKDDGQGIPEKDLKRIFDPFYTTKPTGTGLGLAICHKIIAAHGGDITAHSREGRGSTFRVFLFKSKGKKNEAH